MRVGLLCLVEGAERPALVTWLRTVYVLELYRLRPERHRRYIEDDDNEGSILDHIDILHTVYIIQGLPQRVVTT